MTDDSKVTTDHDEIRRWIEERGGHPASVKDTADDGEVGILRIDFEGYGDDAALVRISWEEFLANNIFETGASSYESKFELANPKQSLHSFNKIIADVF